MRGHVFEGGASMKTIGVSRQKVTDWEPIDLRKPKLAAAMFLGVVPAMSFIQLGTALLLVAFVPAIDLAPVFVLFVVHVSRRWRGVAERWLTVAKMLALVMIAEWIILIMTLVFGPAAGQLASLDSYVPFVLALYAVESLVLLLLMAIAAASSISGILRLQKAATMQIS